jgi:hypothetical protein
VSKGPLPSVVALQQQDGESELFLLRSIEWTIFLDTTFDTALEQANVILRYFLGTFSPLPLPNPCHIYTPFFSFVKLREGYV